MTLELPPADETVAARTSVRMAICQVRFEQQPSISVGATAVAFHGRLGGPEGRYPKLEEAEGANRIVMGIGPAGPISETTRTNGWSLGPADGSWSLALLPNNMGLQSNRYEGWEDFFSRLTDALNALADVVGPSLEQRLGLRFVDQIAGAQFEITSPTEWQPYIAERFLGPLLEPGLGDAVQATQQQLVLDPGDGASCSLRHGLNPPNDDGSREYVIDCDLYREGGRAFDVATILDVVSGFKDQADRLFQAAVTPTLLERLQP